MKYVLNEKLTAISKEQIKLIEPDRLTKYTQAIIFYRFLSDLSELHLDTILDENNIPADDITIEDVKYIEETSMNILGYYIPPEHFYSVLVEQAKTKKPILEEFDKSLKAIQNGINLCYIDFEYNGLFYPANLESDQIGSTPLEKEKTIANLFIAIEELDYDPVTDDLNSYYDAFGMEVLFGEENSY